MNVLAENTSLPSNSGKASHRPIVFLVALAASFLPGIIGSRFRPGEWYSGLAKSSLTPPGWVFPIAWTTLYTLMAVAAWRYLVAASKAKRETGVALFATQLVLNGLWSYLMFGLHRPGLALVEIVVLWASILATLVAFARVDRLAGALLVPYLGWVSFATYLNFAIWHMQ